MNILKRNKLIVCLSLTVLLISSQFLSNEYIDKKVHSDKIPKNINNYDVIQSYDDGNLLMVSNARGYYGMMTSNGREIISPVWNSIEVLSEDRFIVGRIIDSASISMGILDSYENTIIPMLFNTISHENNYFLIGTLSENNKKILFDSLGNIELFQEWDTCEITDNVATLKKGDIIATVSADDNGNCTYTSLKIPFKIFDLNLSVTIKNPLTDGISAYDDYCTIIEKVSTYCEAMFISDTDMIRSVTNSQYYNSLISNMLPNCTLTDVNNILIYGRPNSDGNFGMVYHVNFDLSYTSTATILDTSNTNIDENSQETTTIQLKMEFVRSDEGSIVLKSAEKINFNKNTENTQDEYNLY
ncbi:MAG: hypothetical protein ACI4WH_07015 [Oscillospiraceae bacterium]